MNLLRYFPEDLRCLKFLEELDLSFNQIEYIVPEQLRPFQNLARLNLENNKLDEFPVAQAEQMPNLVDIRLRGNPLLSHGFTYPNSKKFLRPELLDSGKKYRATRKLLPAFATPLDAKLDEDRMVNPGITLPLVFSDILLWMIINSLNVEGIFRQPGKTNVVNKLRDSLNVGMGASFEEEGVTALEVSQIFKLYLRELPVPIFPFTSFPEMVSILQLPNEEQASRYADLIEKLPDVHKHAAYAVFFLMHLVAMNSELNLMHTSNLAKMLAPNLLRQPSSDALDISAISCTNIVIEAIADNYFQVFESKLDPFIHRSLTAEPMAIIHRKVFAHKVPISAGCYAGTSNEFFCTTAANSNNIKIWEARTMDLKRTMEVGVRSVKSLINFGENIWLASNDCIEIRKVADGSLIRTIEKCRAFGFVQYNGCVFSCGAMLLNVHKIEDGEVKETIPLPSPPTALCVANKNIWVACSDYRIRVIDTQTLKITQEFLSSHERKISSIKCVGDEVWTSGDDGLLCVWDVFAYCRVNRISLANSVKTYGLCHFGNIVLSSSWDNTYHIWDSSSQLYLGKWHNLHCEATIFSAATWDDHFQCWMIHSYSRDGAVMVWLFRERPVPSIIQTNSEESNQIISLSDSQNIPLPKEVDLDSPQPPDSPLISTPTPPSPVVKDTTLLAPKESARRKRATTAMEPKSDPENGPDGFSGYSVDDISPRVKATDDETVPTESTSGSTKKRSRRGKRTGTGVPERSQVVEKKD